MPPLAVRVNSLTLSPFCVAPQSSPLMPALILAGAAQAGAAMNNSMGGTASMAAASKKARQVIFPSTFADASLVARRPKRKLGFAHGAKRAFAVLLPLCLSLPKTGGLMRSWFRKDTAWTLTVLVLAAAGTALAQPADTPVNPFAHDPAAIAAGQKVFNSTCTACHGEGASGGRGPALNTGRFAHGANDYDLFQTIRSGVPGTQMPSFAALPADDVWRAVTYIKSLSGRSGGNEVAGGNAAAGETLFFGNGHCASCHEVNGKGAAIAADLSDDGT